MKICYVNKGTSVHDKRFLEHLASKYDTHLISYSNSPLLNLKDLTGLTIHQIPIPSPKMAFPIASLMTPLLIRKIKPDIVSGFYLLTHGFYSALANYHPLVQMAAGSDVLIAPNKSCLHQSIVKFSLKKADSVYIDCEYGKKSILKLGYPEDKIVVFPWGIDLDFFNPNINGRDVRKRLGWENNFIIICTRNHKPVYGVEYLINSMPHIIKKEPSVRFLMIGSGRLTAKLKQMVKDLKIETYVKFIGSIPNEELPKYLAASDIYVSSSLSDGTSVSLLEAMGCGLPVVVTDVNANLEWVINGENGLVIPKKNTTDIIKSICALLKDDNLRKTFGRRNWRIAKERASWSNSVKLLDSMYQSLCR